MMVGPKSPIVLGGSKQDHMPCDFTITTLDGATLEIKGLVTHNPVPKVGQIGPYEVNSCMSREEISKLAPQIIKAANAIRENEKLFGLRPGGIIKHINIVDTGGVNGWVLTNDERIVNITDEGIKQSPRLIGTHESTHAIDLGVGSGSTEGELSQGELTITFNKMKITNLATLPIGGRFGAVMQQPFLRDISESTFYQDNAKTAAGHAWDSPAELLASFVNSLQHPDWENNLKNKSFDFRKQYLDVMSSLGTALVDRPGVPATAPIHSLLDQRKAFLQEVQRNDPTALRVKRFGNEIANMKQLMMDINIGADADN
jgi:hypothetical protein